MTLTKFFLDLTYHHYLVQSLYNTPRYNTDFNIMLWLSTFFYHGILKNFSKELYENDHGKMTIEWSFLYFTKELYENDQGMVIFVQIFCKIVNLWHNWLIKCIYKELIQFLECSWNYEYFGCLAFNIIWAWTWETLTVLLESNKGADQSAHPCSLIIHQHLYYSVK